MPSRALFRSASQIGMIVGISLLLPCSYLHAEPQAFIATLSATLSDLSLGVLQGGTITLVSTERGITRTFTTEASGTYVFSLLPPAVYSLRADAPGFKTYVQNGVSLAAGQGVHLPVVSRDQRRRFCRTSRIHVWELSAKPFESLFSSL